MVGGEAEAKALWPEVEPGTGWSTPSEVAEWEGKWRCANVKPLEIWKAQGTGIGLPMIIPLRENPRGDKALMDQLVNTGTRTIKGVAAVNGLALRRMRVGTMAQRRLTPDLQVGSSNLSGLIFLPGEVKPQGGPL